MKNVKYKISEGESVSLIPDGSIILDAKIVFEEKDENTVLIYLPKTLKYEFEGEVSVDKGDTGSLSFATFNEKCGCWIKTDTDYMNITIKKFEK